MPTLLDVNGISKNYHQGATQIQALKSVSLHIEKGETLALVGSSGSGKSTFLNCVSGLEQPDTGEIVLSGQDLSQLSTDEMSQFRGTKMGIVFQDFHLIPHFTALENVRLPLDIHSPEKSTDEACMNVLDLVGLAERAQHRPQQLSGGERQRVAIARAIIHGPDLILADEPSGNLDTETGNTIMSTLFDLIREKKQTLLLVTHNPAHAALCDKQVQLSAGSFI